MILSGKIFVFLFGGFMMRWNAENRCNLY